MPGDDPSLNLLVVACGARYSGVVRVDTWVAVAIVAALFMLMVTLAGLMLGAVVARRRTQALIQGRLAELWEVMRSAVDLTEDASKTFAVISVLPIPVAFIVPPAVGTVIFIVL